MEFIIELASLILLIVLLFIVIFKKNHSQMNGDTLTKIYKDELSRLKKELMDENSNQRIELNQTLQMIKHEINQNLKDNKVEINNCLDQFRKTISEKMDSLTNQQKENNEKIIEKQNIVRLETEKKLENNSGNLSKSFENLNISLKQNLSEFGDNQRKYAEEYIRKHDDIKKATDDKLELIRKTVEDKLMILQNENSKKLDEMRHIVDRKLQETLDKKLSDSFNTVSQQLQEVYKGLGEMKTLANDVGGLKKVLTNVKTRGIIGEIQLGNILESILSPEQYEHNVAIKPNSQERVEYAIKLPGKDNTLQSVYLPIDSKFPDSAYQNLLKAYDEADADKITQCRKELEKTIKAFSKDVYSKYINPPYSTDFAIIFLPFEGLYAEVLQNTNLVHQIQNDYHINIAGPTTLGAFINSLQMGFKTLAIEKRSSEVWKLLSTIKTEFTKFGGVLANTQNKLKVASDELDKLVGTRTRKIQSALKSVELMPDHSKLNELDKFEESEDIQI